MRPCGNEKCTQKAKTSYCSEICRQQVRHDRKLNRKTLSTGDVGAIGELRVSVDLLQKGYEVFRAVSQACSCDLVCQKNGRSVRLEVRTGTEHRTDEGFSFPKAKKDSGRSEHYAVVLPTRIVYVPELS